MTEPRLRKCRNCRFMDVHNPVHNPELAFCHKLSPAARPTSGQAWWPQTELDEWCGEWQVPEGEHQGVVALAELRRLEALT